MPPRNPPHLPELDGLISGARHQSVSGGWHPRDAGHVVVVPSQRLEAVRPSPTRIREIPDLAHLKGKARVERKNGLKKTKT